MVDCPCAKQALHKSFSWGKTDKLWVIDCTLEKIYIWGPVSWSALYFSFLNNLTATKASQLFPKFSIFVIG